MLFQWLLFLFFTFNSINHDSLPFLFTVDVKKEVAHPFYVSVTEINYNKPEKTLEISCKIFADDLEDVLKQNYKTTIDLTNGKQQATLQKLIHDYISHHLKITIDNKPLTLHFIGFEKDKESAYCYFEVQDIAAVKKLQIANSILQDLTPQQINIIHVTVNGKRQSIKLDYPQKLAAFTF